MISVAATWPHRILYGTDALDQLGVEMTRARAGRAMLATDAYHATTDAAGRIREAAKKESIEIHVFDRVEASPSEGNIYSLAREISDKGCGLIIAIGSGTVIDCAKAANLVATRGGSLSDYRGNKGTKISHALLPLIAIPTTAGTGAEVTPDVAVTDVAKRRSYTISSSHLVPALAILDPALTVLMSQQVTAWTGMDALGRAIEALCSPLDSPIANSLALDAIGRIASSLPILLRSGRAIQARGEMLLAANMAGIAQAQNQLGLIHAISHQINAEFGVEPSLASAIFLPPVMEFNRDFVEVQYGRIARAMDVRVRNMSQSAAAQKAVYAVRELAIAAGIPEKFEGIVATDDVIHRLASNVMADPLATLNPRPVTAHDVEYLLQQVL